MLANTGISTFKELRPSVEPGKDLARPYDIIFVHGLNGRGSSRLRKSLKGWLRSLDSPSSVRAASIYAFGFNATDLLLKGKKRLLELSSHLRNAAQVKGGGRNLIFIGYSIAGWVVQESLASYASGPLLPRTTGVIFLGLPEFEANSDWDNFRKRFLDKFSRNASSIHLLEFPLLQNTDSNFRILSSSDSALVVEHIPIPVESGLARLAEGTVKRQGTDSSASTLSTTGEVDLHQLSLFNIQQKDETHNRVVIILDRMMSEKSQTIISHQSHQVLQHQRMQPYNPSSSPASSSPFSPILKPSEIFVSRDKAQLTNPSMDPDLITDYSSDMSALQNSGKATDRSNAETTKGKDYAAANPNKPDQTDLVKLAKLASLYHQSGELQQANLLYKKFTEGVSWLAVDPSWHFAVECDKALILLHEGHFEQAEYALTRLEQESLSELPKNHHKKWEIARWLGVTFDKRGNYGKAKQKLSEELTRLEIVLVEGPYSEMTLARDAFLLTENALALALSHLGDFKEALRRSDDALSLAREAVHKVAATRDEDQEEKLSRRFNRIHSDRALILTCAGNYDEADSINRQSVKIMEKIHGTRHFATLDCWALEARLLLAKSKVDEAEEVCHKTLKGMREEIGAEHPSTLQALETLVLVYTSQARLTEARNTARYLLDMNVKVLGPDHPQTINSRCVLSAVYIARGETGSALALQEEALEAANRILKPKHPTTLAYMADLASLHGARGDRISAKDIARRAFMGQCEIFLSDSNVSNLDNGKQSALFGSAQEAGSLDDKGLFDILRLFRSRKQPLDNIHPSFFSTMHYLCVSERERETGDLNLALEFATQAVKCREEKLGADHASTLSSLLELAITERQQGDLQSAKKKIKKVLNARIQTLGEFHPDSLSARHELSIATFFSGYIEEAAYEQEGILKLRILLFGDSHPDVVRSKLDLSISYHVLGRLDDAEALRWEVLEAQLLISHPTYFSDWTEFNVGRSMHTNDALRESLINYTANMKLKRHDPNTSGKTVTFPSTRQLSPEVLSSISNLASIYADKEDFTKALELQQILVSSREVQLGPKDPVTLGSLSDQASMYQAVEQIKQATELYQRVKDTLGRNSSHPSLYWTSHLNLASLYFSAGQTEEAENMQIEAFEHLQKPQDFEDPQALVRTMFNLALTKETFVKIRDVSLLQQIVEFSEKILGFDHPLSIEMAESLENWTNEQEPLDEASLAN